jgi:NADP-dependent 3-hydroxy acid dehydrogenase YdfG
VLNYDVDSRSNCFITGASSGIGEAIARVFAAAGAKLILVARRQERLEQLADELHKFTSAVHLLPLDVCSREASPAENRASVESALTNLPASWSSVDILINNAGLSRGLDKLHEGSFQRLGRNDRYQY